MLDTSPSTSDIAEALFIPADLDFDLPNPEDEGIGEEEFLQKV